MRARTSHRSASRLRSSGVLNPFPVAPFAPALSPALRSSQNPLVETRRVFSFSLSPLSTSTRHSFVPSVSFRCARPQLPSPHAVDVVRRRVTVGVTVVRQLGPASRKPSPRQRPKKSTQLAVPDFHAPLPADVTADLPPPPRSPARLRSRYASPDHTAAYCAARAPCRCARADRECPRRRGSGVEDAMTDSYDRFVENASSYRP